MLKYLFYFQVISKSKKPKVNFSSNKELNKTKPGRRKRRRLQRSRSPTSKPCTVARHQQSQVPTEIIERFPLALAEINRKLFGQNLIWAGL